MAYATKAKLRAYQRRWDNAKAARWRRAGCCVNCGLPTTPNPGTGKPFARCFAHRLYHAAEQLRYKRRLKDAA